MKRAAQIFVSLIFIVWIFASVSLLQGRNAVSYTHLRAHETVLDLVCRLLLEKKKTYKILYTL